MNIRLTSNMEDRARACAKAVGEPLNRWVAIVLNHWHKGKLAFIWSDWLFGSPRRVVGCEESPFTTQNNSESVKLGGIDGIEAKELRKVILAGVLWCEPRNPPPPEVIEGIHYIRKRGE